MREVFQQNNRWCCTACWQTRQLLQPIYGEFCPCGVKRPYWAKHKAEAAPHAVLAAFKGDYGMVNEDECPGCTRTHESGPLTLCMDCGGSWFAGWEFPGLVDHFAATGEASGWGMNENFEI